MPKISVIIPLYNKEKAIRNTINSVLKQTYTDFELFIIDDGSTDNSPEIAQKMAKTDHRIQYIQKENGGVSSARNYGLQQSKGEWIIFLDADDEMLSNNLETLLGLVQKYKTNIATASFRICQSTTRHVAKSRLNKEKVVKNFILASFKYQVTFPPGATIFRRSIFKEKPPYNENLCRYEDCEFEINLFNKNSIAISPKQLITIHTEFSELSKVRNINLEKDFIFSMDFSDKTFWQKVYMGRFIQEGAYTYPNSTPLLKQKYASNYYYRYIFWGINKFYNLIYRIKDMK